MSPIRFASGSYSRQGLLASPCTGQVNRRDNEHDLDDGERPSYPYTLPLLTCTDHNNADDYTYICTVCGLELSADEVGAHVCYPD